MSPHTAGDAQRVCAETILFEMADVVIDHPGGSLDGVADRAFASSDWRT